MAPRDRRIDSHSVRPEIQGDHGETPPASSLTSEVVAWLNRSYPKEPMDWVLQIEGHRPAARGFYGVKVFSNSEINPCAIELRVRPKGEELQWRCLLIAPTFDIAVRVIVDSRPEAAAHFISLGGGAFRELAEARGKPPTLRKKDKQRQAAESTAGYARSLMGRSSLRAICYRLKQRSPHNRPLTRRTIRDILSESIPDKKVVHTAWVFLLWNLVEAGYLEPTSSKGERFQPTLLVEELATEHAKTVHKKEVNRLQTKLALARSQLSRKEQELRRLEKKSREVSGDIERIKREIAETKAAIAEK